MSRCYNRNPRYAFKPEEAAPEDHLARPDYLNAPGAHALKARIEAYWRERGRRVEVRVVGEARGGGMGVVFGLASDIGFSGARQHEP